MLRSCVAFPARGTASGSPHSWLPPLAGDDSDHEFYGRLFGDPADAQRALPTWAGGAGAYTPFEYVEFEDTEVHHDLEIMVSGRSLRVMLARSGGASRPGGHGKRPRAAPHAR